MNIVILLFGIFIIIIISLIGIIITLRIILIKMKRKKYIYELNIFYPPINYQNNIERIRLLYLKGYNQDALVEIEKAIKETNEETEELELSIYKYNTLHNMYTNSNWIKKRLYKKSYQEYKEYLFQQAEVF